jgi:hypothetical protein
LLKQFERDAGKPIRADGPREDDLGSRAAGCQRLIGALP